jgi:hypothetical protein
MEPGDSVRQDEAGVMITLIRSHCLVRQIVTKNHGVQLFMQSAVHRSYIIATSLSRPVYPIVIVALSRLGDENQITFCSHSHVTSPDIG